MTARDPLRDVLVMDLMVGGLTRKAAEEQVAAYDAARRAGVLREAAAFVASQVFWFDPRDRQGVIDALLAQAAAPTTTQEQ